MALLKRRRGDIAGCAFDRLLISDTVPLPLGMNTTE